MVCFKFIKKHYSSTAGLYRQNTYTSTLFLCLFIVSLYMINIKLKTDVAVIISATYFKESTIYPPNTMVFVLSAHTRFDRRRVFDCLSSNATASLHSVVEMRRAYKPVAICKWTTYIAICPVVHAPKEFALSKTNVKHSVSVRHPPAERLPVVACFSPLFFNEHWQLLLTTLHLYQHFGVSLQAVYVQSMLTGLFRVLREYEERGFVAIEPWAHIPFDNDTIRRVGYNPNFELDWRNQASAHTDCFVKYREAAEFILVGDLDDVLLPRLSDNLLDEFRLLSRLYPSAAGFTYDRFDASSWQPSSPSTFSLQAVLRSTVVSQHWEDGKYVVSPRRVETAWLHWPGLTVNGSEMHHVHEETNVMLHFRKWRPSLQTAVSSRSAKFRLSDVVPASVISAIEESYQQMKGLVDDFLSPLGKQSSGYTKKIGDCYNRMFYGKSRVPGRCPGPIRCELDPVPGLDCVVIRQHYAKAIFSQSFYLFHPLRTEFVESHDGCFM